jgi:hypothetical protein
LIHIFFPWKKEPKNSAICVIYNKLSYSRGKNSPNLATLVCKTAAATNLWVDWKFASNIDHWSPGLPDFFSNQKSQFGYILEGLGL